MQKNYIHIIKKSLKSFHFLCSFLKKFYKSVHLLRVNIYLNEQVMKKNEQILVYKKCAFFSLHLSL